MRINSREHVAVGDQDVFVLRSLSGLHGDLSFNRNQIEYMLAGSKLLPIQRLRSDRRKNPCILNCAPVEHQKAVTDSGETGRHRIVADPHWTEALRFDPDAFVTALQHQGRTWFKECNGSTDSDSAGEILHVIDAQHLVH